jgi:hypothetical protein
MQTTANSHSSLSSFHRIIQNLSGPMQPEQRRVGGGEQAKAHSWLAKKQERCAVGSDGSMRCSINKEYSVCELERSCVVRHATEVGLHAVAILECRHTQLLIDDESALLLFFFELFWTIFKPTYGNVPQLTQRERESESKRERESPQGWLSKRCFCV